MNIVFFGSSKFAESSLKALSDCGHKVACAVTQPDRQKGRGLHFSATLVKEAAHDCGIRIYQPQNVNDPDSVKFLKELKPDLFIVIAYGQILSREVLDIPRLLPINIHASLLPKYRGAAPINWAIIKGESKTGISIIKMTDKMDAGPVILQEETGIDGDDTAATLEDKLSALAAKLLLRVLGSVEDGSYNLTPQDEGGVSFAPKLKKEYGKINWKKPAGDIHNLIRGCITWPGAFTCYKGKLLKIYMAEVLPQALPCGTCVPGEISDVSKEGITVVTGRGNLVIKELQIEGKRVMKAHEFIAGHKVSVAQVFR